MTGDKRLFVIDFDRGINYDTVSSRLQILEYKINRSLKSISFTQTQIHKSQHKTWLISIVSR